MQSRRPHRSQVHQPEVLLTKAPRTTVGSRVVLWPPNANSSCGLVAPECANIQVTVPLLGLPGVTHRVLHSL